MHRPPPGGLLLLGLAALPAMYESSEPSMAQDHLAAPEQQRTKDSIPRTSLDPPPYESSFRPLPLAPNQRASSRAWTQLKLEGVHYRDLTASDLERIEEAIRASISLKNSDGLVARDAKPVCILPWVSEGCLLIAAEAVVSHGSPGASGTVELTSEEVIDLLPKHLRDRVTFTRHWAPLSETALPPNILTARPPLLKSSDSTWTLELEVSGIDIAADPDQWEPLAVLCCPGLAPLDVSTDVRFSWGDLSPLSTRKIVLHIHRPSDATDAAVLRIALRRRAPAAMDAEKSAEFEHSDECEDSAGEGGRGPGAGPRVFSETAPEPFLSTVVRVPVLSSKLAQEALQLKGSYGFAKDLGVLLSAMNDPLQSVAPSLVNVALKMHKYAASSSAAPALADWIESTVLPVIQGKRSAHELCIEQNADLTFKCARLEKEYLRNCGRRGRGGCLGALVILPLCVAGHWAVGGLFPALSAPLVQIALSAILFSAAVQSTGGKWAKKNRLVLTAVSQAGMYAIIAYSAPITSSLLSSSRRIVIQLVMCAIVHSLCRLPFSVAILVTPFLTAMQLAYLSRGSGLTNLSPYIRVLGNLASIAVMYVFERKDRIDFLRSSPSLKSE